MNRRSTRTHILLGAALLAALGTAIGIASLDGRRDGPKSAPDAPARVGELDREPLVEARVSQGRLEAVSAPRLPAANGRVTLGRWQVAGRVTDWDGNPVIGVEVAPFPLRPGAARARTAADGSFRIEVPAGRHDLKVVDPSFVTVAVSSVEIAPGRREQRLIAAPAMEVAGSTVDESEHPLEGARLRVEFSPAEVADRLPSDMEAAVHRWEVRTNELGGFSFAALPRGIPAAVGVSLPGFETKMIALPSDGLLDWTISLRRTADSVELRGLVLTESGQPVPAAQVRLGRLETLSDDRGAFRLVVGERDLHQDLVATKADIGAAVLHPLQFTSDDQRELEVVLRLSLPWDGIAGRVMDAEGRGIPGCLVSLLLPSDDSCGYRDSAVGPLAPFLARESGADGRFELRGFLELKTYHLKVSDKASGTTQISRPVAVGTRDAEIRISPEQPLPLSGTVVSRSGAPLSGARVQARPRFQTSGIDWLAAPISVRSDARGRFRLSCQAEQVNIVATAEGYLPCQANVTSHDLPGELRLELQPSVTVVLETVGTISGMETLEAWDTLGSRLPLHPADADGWTEQLPVATGLMSTLVYVPEDARRLVLLRRDQLLASAPIPTASRPLVRLEIPAQMDLLSSQFTQRD